MILRIHQFSSPCLFVPSFTTPTNNTKNCQVANLKTGDCFEISLTQTGRYRLAHFIVWRAWTTWSFKDAALVSYNHIDRTVGRHMYCMTPRHILRQSGHSVLAFLASLGQVHPNGMCFVCPTGCPHVHGFLLPLVGVYWTRSRKLAVTVCTCKDFMFDTPRHLSPNLVLFSN